jgi:hypothetical protein
VVIVYANGDSNTYGDELVPPRFISRLPDINQADGSILKPRESRAELKELDTYRLKNAWPSVFGRSLGASKIINEGERGGSNDRMFRMTLAWLSDNAELCAASKCGEIVVVLGFTGLSRTEKFNDDARFPAWTQIGPTFGPSDAHKAYYDHLHTFEGDFCRFWAGVVAVQNTCLLLGVDFIFFNAYPEHLSGVDMIKPNRFSSLIDTNHMVPETMWEFCADTPMGPRMHFLSEGHRTWGKHLVNWHRSR